MDTPNPALKLKLSMRVTEVCAANAFSPNPAIMEMKPMNPTDIAISPKKVGCAMRNSLPVSPGIHQRHPSRENFNAPPSADDGV